MKISKISISVFAAVALGLLSATAHAAAAGATMDVSIVNVVTESIKAASGKILPMAIAWLSALMTIQFIVTQLSVLKSGGEINDVWGKLLGSLLWFAFCFYVLTNGPEFINLVGNGIIKTFGPNMIGPGTIMAYTTGICLSLLGGIAATGTSIVGTGNTAVAMVLVYVLFTVFFLGMYMAIKVFMLSLELGIVVVMAPLGFAFLGLNALKDQGIAPLKSLVTLVYRIVLMGIIMTAFTQVIGLPDDKFDKLDWGVLSDFGSAVQMIFTKISAFPVLAYLVFKSDAIAATLASGSTNMGPADVAGAAAAGAAAGVAIASGGGMAAKIGKSMADFGSKKLDVKNAETSGRGGAETGLNKMQASFSSPPTSTSSDSQNGGFETNSKGAPMRPESGSGAEEAGASAASASPTSGFEASARSAGGGDGQDSNASVAVASGGGGGGGGGQSVAAGASLQRSGSRSTGGRNVARPNSSDPRTAQMHQGDATPSRGDGAIPSGGGENTLQNQIKNDSKRVEKAAASGGDYISAADKRNRGEENSQSGSGSSAAIGGGGGANSDVAAALERMEAQLNKQNAPTKSSLRQAFSNANHHLAQEKATTSVSINANASD